VARAQPDPELEDLFQRLARLGQLSARRMFGATGLYADGVFFGLIDEGVLYFKVDDETVGTYQARGAGPFRPFKDRPKEAMHGYYEVPESVLERDGELFEFARAAVGAGRRRDARKRPAAAKKRAPAKPQAVPVERLLNLGPVSSAWLREVGIATRADLERIGAVEAYLRVAAAGHGTSLNLLYALEGARLDLHWHRLSEEIKANLRVRARSAQRPAGKARRARRPPQRK
jgi:TfoX/Sxy family transcriptional regulator of competence genes